MVAKPVFYFKKYLGKYINSCFIYHYWTQEPKKVWRDLLHPVIHSIAMLRGNGHQEPVYILDLSGHANNYGNFPECLRFTVIPSMSTMRMARPLTDLNSFRLSSRTFDISKFAFNSGHDLVIFLDCDVFLNSNMFPLEQDPDYFCCHCRNTGVWYYRPQSPRVIEFFSIWKKQTLRLFHDPLYQQKISLNYCGNTHSHNDEAVYRYLLEVELQGWDRFVKPLTYRENFGREFFGYFPPDVKCYHFQHGRSGMNRGYFPIVIREFYQKISKACDPNHIDLLAGNSPRGVISLLDMNPGQSNWFFEQTTPPTRFFL